MGRLRNFEVRVFRRLRRDPPQGRIHRLAFWLLVSYVLLALGRILPALQGQLQRAEVDYLRKVEELDRTRKVSARLSEPVAICGVAVNRKK